MSAGQVWEHPDGLRWVEVQAEAIEPSGWRLMVPLVDLDDAVDAPPLVVTVDGYRARVHLITCTHVDDLGAACGHIVSADLARLRRSAAELVAHDGPSGSTSPSMTNAARSSSDGLART